jgi:hypothetical protein
VVPPQIQPRARADLDHGERPPVPDGREGRQQRRAARRLVGLGAAGGEGRLQPVEAIGAEAMERLAEPGPRPVAAGARVVRRELVARVA